MKKSIQRNPGKAILAVSGLMIIIVMTGMQPSTGKFDDYFEEKTLRVDYLQTGMHDTAWIKITEIFSEPYWGGSQVNMIDTFGYGRYYFTLKDRRSGRVIYSRGYSTLFAEWQDTEEAKMIRMSFRESLVMPFPRKPVILEIYRRDKQNRLHRMQTKEIDTRRGRVTGKVVNYYDVTDVVIHGSPDNKLDIVFIAEGYSSSEQEMFKDDCKRFAGYLLGASPFKEHREKINIRGIGAISEESGVTIPGENIYRKTAVGSSFYTFESERYLMAQDFQRIRDIASLVPYDQIFIIVNSDKYGGGGIFNYYATGTRGNRAADFLLIHEFGHSFAGLGDEYYTSDVAVNDFYDLDTEPWEPNITTLVDFGRKWADLLPSGTEIPTTAIPENADKIGVYEGGGYAARGIYRPFIDCTMKSVKYDAFCPVCRQAISRMIIFYSE
ncbi:MAG: M64 family metallopeptidase [Bacteroidales bacterium]